MLVIKRKNKYIERGRISERKFREFLELFCLDLTASQITQIIGLNRNTVNRLMNAIRMRMAELCEIQARLAGIMKADESYFGQSPVQGKRGRDATEKTIIFGVLKQGDKVYTEIVPDSSKAVLQSVIRGKVSIESVILAEGWTGYDCLVDLGYQKHFRVRHSENELAKNGFHINGIESFWAISKHRLDKFRGVRKDKFYLYLKECEFRFNNRHNNLYKVLLKELRLRPLS